MTIKTDIRHAFNASRLAKDGMAPFYSTLIGEMENEVSRKPVAEQVVTDEIAISVLKKFLKNLQELQAREIEIGATSSKTAAEIAIVEKFLPQQMTEDQLRGVINDAIASGVAYDMKTFMVFLKEHYAGQYDGKMAATLAKELLA